MGGIHDAGRWRLIAPNRVISAAFQRAVVPEVISSRLSSASLTRQNHQVSFCPVTM